MPRLPNASDLSAVNPGASRSFVNMQVADIAGATNAVARGVADAGQGVSTFAAERKKKFAAQERFNTKIGLLRAEEAYADRVKDLDPLDPEYVEKKKAARREIFAPVLSSVKDPDNKMDFDLATEEDYVNIGLKAQGEAKLARREKTKVDLTNYADAQRKLLAAGADPEKTRADVLQMLQDADLDELTRLELERTLLDPIDMDAAETKAFSLQTGTGGATEKAAAILRQFEGFRSTPYHDVNADRVGYGSDTVTLADGTVVKVTKGMKITKADAERDLKRRVAEFQTAAAKDAGPAWNDLTPDQQAALTSVAYNYGSLPKRVVAAIQTGDANRIADAVESLSDHNAGVNRKRRMAEGALIRGEASVPSSWSERPSLETVVSELERDPSYLRLGVDAREKVKASVVSRYEKIAAEEKKSADINTAREAANAAAAGVTNLADGYKWLDENIQDPEVREKARTMFKSEFEANEKTREAEYKTFVSSVTADVMNAVNRGDAQAALEAIPAEGLQPDDYEKLLERVSKGPVQFDDFRALEKLRHMKYADTEQFAEVNLMDYAPVLKQGTLDKLIEDQANVRKGLEKTGKIPSVEARSKLLNETYDIMGLDTTKTVGRSTRQANERTRQRIASIFESNVQMAVDRAGRELQPEELRRVMDDTMLEFTRKERNKGWSEDYDTAVQQGLTDVFTLFDEQEAKINAAIEVENQKRIAAGKPVENLYSPGELLRRAQEELATFNAAERRRVTQEIKAIERGQRSPTTAVRDVALDERYIRLQREKQALEEFEINAQTLYEWMAVTFAQQNRNAE